MNTPARVAFTARKRAHSPSLAGAFPSGQGLSGCVLLVGMGLAIHLCNQAALFRHLVLDGLHGCLEAWFRADIYPPGPLVLVITSQDGELLCYQLLA